jgi:WD40 repeat protein
MLSYTFLRDEYQGNLLGINRIKSYNGNLYSAGRDSCIYIHKPNEDSYNSYRIDAHNDWVNDICFMNDSLISCSSDCTIRIEDIQPNSSRKVEFISAHSDFVKRISPIENHKNQIVSGGLDRKIKCWDLNNNLELLFEFTQISSIYSLTTTPNSDLIISGGHDKLLRLYDYKQQKQIFKLHGHGDNIRDILCIDDEFILSASSDCTVKKWSLKAMRCVETFKTDTSVWCLCKGDEGSLFYGTKGGKVFDLSENKCLIDCAIPINDVTLKLGLF